MLLIFFVVGLAVSTSAHYHSARHRVFDGSNAVHNHNLKLVHVLFRHGERTPADTYPTDPYINDTFAPYGWGQLTNQGRKYLFDTGKWLRKRYNSFLGRNFYPEIVHAQSTGVSRTKMSLLLALAGLFPPSGTPNSWNDYLNWQPIPYDYQPLDEDTLLLVRTPCARYHEEYDRVFSEEPEIVQLQRDNRQLYDELTEFTGMEIRTPEDIQSLYSTLKAEEGYGLQLPEWTNRYYPDRLLPLAEKSYIFNVYNDELKKLKGGPFVAKLIDDWNGIKSGTFSPKSRKIFLYAGHDSSVANILSAFNIWQQQFPGYGIMGVFELYENKRTKELSVKFFLRTETKTQLLIVPGCDALCPLEKLKQLTANVIPEKDGSDCISNQENYSLPPLRGP